MGGTPASWSHCPTSAGAAAQAIQPLRDAVLTGWKHPRANPYPPLATQLSPTPARATDLTRDIEVTINIARIKMDTLTPSLQKIAPTLNSGSLSPCACGTDERTFNATKSGRGAFSLLAIRAARDASFCIVNIHGK